jgi:hypothetical protein
MGFYLNIFPTMSRYKTIQNWKQYIIKHPDQESIMDYVFQKIWIMNVDQNHTTVCMKGVENHSPTIEK